MHIVFFFFFCVCSGSAFLSASCDFFPSDCLASSSVHLSMLKEQLNEVEKTVNVTSDSRQSKEHNKKILILSSHGGYGHTAATKALQQILGANYSVSVVHPIDETMVFCGINPEKFYNKMMSYGWYQFTNFLARHIGPFLFRQRYGKIEELVAHYIDKEQADIVVSVIPFVNFPASEAARKKSIPYLVISTDNDLSNWVQDVEKITHPFFEITTGTEPLLTKDLLVSKNILSHNIYSIGLPIRSNFYEKKNRQKIRKEFGFGKKPTVLIMMGGASAKLAYQYAKTLAEEDLSIQLVVVSGNNEDLLHKIKEIVPHPSNSIYPIGFTDRVSDFMAVSDLLISKPGPGTISEAIQMRLPILVDNSSSSVFWEKINQDIVSYYSIGEVISLNGDLCTQVRKYLYNDQFKKELKNGFKQIPLNGFHSGINRIVSNLILNSRLHRDKFNKLPTATQKQESKS